MAKQRPNRLQEKYAPKKKHLIDPRYSSPVWTAVFIVIMIIIFIINNTRNEPNQGPYPPYYLQSKTTPADTGSAK